MKKIESPEWNTARLETLTDGVFAIAMTILVLDLKLGAHLQKLTSDQLVTEVTNLWPNVLHYVESFIILATFWIKHHQQYYLINKMDMKLIWVNIFGLLFICLIPFSASVAGDFGHHRFAVFMFEVNLLIAGLIFYWQWNYATYRRRLVDKDLNEDLIKSYRLGNLIVPVISILAICLSFFSARWGSLPYIAVPAFFFFFQKKVTIPHNKSVLS